MTTAIFSTTYKSISSKLTVRDVVNKILLLYLLVPISGDSFLAHEKRLAIERQRMNSPERRTPSK